MTNHHLSEVILPYLLFRDRLFLLQGIFFTFISFLFVIESRGFGYAQLLIGIPLGWLTFKRPRLGTTVLFFLIPSTNFLGNVLFTPYRAVPFLLGPFACWVFAVLLSVDLGQRSILPVASHFITTLQVMWGVSLGVAVVRCGSFRPLNPLGWVLLGYLIWTGGLMLFLLLATITEQDRLASWEAWGRALSVGLLVALILGGYQALGHPSVGNSPASAFRETSRINASFFDPNAFGAFLIMGVPFLLGLVESPRATPLWQVLWLIELAGLMVLLPFSGSRSGLLGTGTALLCWGVWCFQTDRVRIKKHLFTGLVLLILVSSFMSITGRHVSQLPVFQRMKVDLPPPSTSLEGTSRGLTRQLLSIRWNNWKGGWKLFRRYPVLGTGIGNYLTMLNRHRRQFPLQVENDNSGNYYLQIAAETGILTFSVMLGFLVLTARRGWKRIRETSDPRLLGAFAGLLGMWVAFLFGPHILSFEVSLLYWYQISVLWLAPSPGRAVT